jgi:hypothetical protein
MSRVSVSRIKFDHADYGVIGAGALSKSLIGQLPRKSRQIGFVAGVSFRVASRMANSLRAGHPARCADELDSSPVILFHAPAIQVPAIALLLAEARIQWKDKPLIFCDCEVPLALLERFRNLGASTATARQFGIAGTMVVAGTAPALTQAHRLAVELRLRAIEIPPGELFAAALTLATSALTPLINRAADMLRACGLRDKVAVQMAAALFQQTVQEYDRSGRQSWAWHVRQPDADQIEAEIAAVTEPFRGLFRQLILLGFDDFEKHGPVAEQLRKKNAAEQLRKENGTEQLRKENATEQLRKQNATAQLQENAAEQPPKNGMR